MNTPINRLAFVVVFTALLSCAPGSNPTPQTPGTKGTIATIAGTHGSSTYSGDGGPASGATFLWVTGVATDLSNNIYISDGAANTVRKISLADGTIVTIAGKFRGSNIADQTPAAGDGGAATDAHLNVPLAIAVDGQGDVAIADAGNDLVRMVASSSGIISTFAGTARPAIITYAGDGGPAASAQLWNPYSVAMDASGNLYIADAENNAIRKVDRATGIITTFAGMGPDHAGYTGDESDATLATLNGPQGICVDLHNNVYISDTNNAVVRVVSGGIITTFAGSGATGYSGDGGPARQAKFSSIGGIAVDANGNVYIADAGNSVVRMVNIATGTISTVAGSGAAGYSGDGGPATSAKLNDPIGVAVGSNGVLYIADSQNSVVRAVRLN
jgi:sugar lactone lactonase YvrE